jgi:hypothetical protein
MQDADTSHRQAVALFRYGLIADLVRLPPGAKARGKSNAGSRPCVLNC